MGERGGADCGLSIVEAAIALCLATALTALALPLTGNTVDEGRARQAAAFMAARLRDAKHQATMRGASAGLVFNRQSGRWLFELCLDGNANGLRRADLDAGLDTCPGEPLDLAVLFPGISVAVDPAIRGPEGDPPTADPVRFGASDIASCSAFGGCTAGSLFLRSGRGVQFMVRIAGVTGRTRVLRYDAAAELWKER
jgi:hypothetical protein